MTDPVFEITKAASFDAAHYLPDGPKDSPYTRLHGHSFKVEATVRGPEHGPVGWVADLGGRADDGGGHADSRADGGADHGADAA